MSKKRDFEAPTLPTTPNLEAFIRGGQDTPAPMAEPSAKPRAPREPTYPVQIKLPRSWKQRIEHRLTDDGKTLQDIGRAAFEKYAWPDGEST